jgi:membrane-associated phospholipid phosphatase
MNKDTIIFAVVALLFFVVAILSHYFSREYSWWMSVESWVPWLQSWDNGLWKRFLQLIHLLGWELLWGLVILFYCKFNRASSAFLIILTCDVVAIVVALKMLWNDPATYMDKEYIKAWACDQNTFQTPSLEVTMAAFTYSMMFYLAYDWIDVIRPRIKKQVRESVLPNDEIVYEDDEDDYFLSAKSRYQSAKANDLSFWIWLSVIFFLVIMIGLASMYLGVNSFDQVFFGMFLGYGLFCVFYFVLKDLMIEKYIIISEKMAPSSQTITGYVVHLVVVLIALLAIRVLYYFQVMDFTVNPKWKSEHHDLCGPLPFPSFFDKEMLFAYNFLYLNLGVMTGLVLDSLLLGGTRIDYNQIRKGENRNEYLGLFLRLVITIVWVLLTVWLLDYLISLLFNKWMFVLAIPYFVCGFGLFTFLKYIFQIVGATRPEIYPIPEMSSVELRRAD